MNRSSDSVKSGLYLGQAVPRFLNPGHICVMLRIYLRRGRKCFRTKNEQSWENQAVIDAHMQCLFFLLLNISIYLFISVDDEQLNKRREEAWQMLRMCTHTIRRLSHRLSPRHLAPRTRVPLQTAKRAHARERERREERHQDRGIRRFA